MRYQALATDYDGTIARDGGVDDRTLDVLRELKASGRRLVLVSGRRLPDLRRAFPEVDDLFDRIVAENGALLYDPAVRVERLLCPPVDESFVAALRERRVEPLSVGRAIVATLRPQETVTREVIRDLGLQLALVHNKDAVMVLPAGVGKAGGLAAALAELGVPSRRTVGVGDAENDVAFLELCGCAAVVADALPALKRRADLVLDAADGEGVRDLARRLLAGELDGAQPGDPRQQTGPRRRRPPPDARRE